MATVTKIKVGNTLADVEDAKATAHIADKVSHITKEERNKWNNMVHIESVSELPENPDDNIFYIIQEEE